MNEQLLKYIGVALTCAVKYIFGVLGALTTGLNFFETLITTLVGGMTGVFVYLYLWDLITFLYRKFVPKKPKVGGIKISATKRWIVKVIVKYELYGIAFLTPLLLSVPIGTLLAAAIEPNKWRIKRFMFCSFLGWTLLLYGIYSLFGIRIDAVL
jgi:hypothetical protein